VADSDVSVRPEGLHETARALRTQSAQLENILASLAQRVNGLEAHWDGAARQAYSQAQREWSAALGDMTSVLASVANATDDFAGGYVHDDKASAQRFTHQG